MKKKLSAPATMQTGCRKTEILWFFGGCFVLPSKRDEFRAAGTIKFPIGFEAEMVGHVVSYAVSFSNVSTGAVTI